MKISETALVLNADGSIYHLNLLPGELAETIILVGDPARTSLVSKHFDSLEVNKQKREFVIQTGYIGKQRLSVIGTGIGSGNIEIVMTEADALHNIDFSTRQIKTNPTSLRFIRLGTAGALQKDIPVDSFILANSAIGFDGLLNFYQLGKDSELLRAFKKHFAVLPMSTNTYSGKASTQLNNLFKKNCLTGITLTCVGFYAPQYRQLRAPLITENVIQLASEFRYNNDVLTNFEMETAAIFGLGNVLNHQCCSISAIVLNRLTKVVSQNSVVTIEKMIEMAIEKII